MSRRSRDADVRHRKRHQLKELGKEHLRIANQVRFVTEVVAAARRPPPADQGAGGGDGIGFAKIQPESRKKKGRDDDDDDDDAAGGSRKGGRDKGYDYLLNMNIRALTLEKVEKLKKQLREKTAQMRTLRATTGGSGRRTCRRSRRRSGASRLSWRPTLRRRLTRPTRPRGAS